jgi:hypothetical protein
MQRRLAVSRQQREPRTPPRSDNRPRAKITVLPTNIGLVHPAVQELSPLLGYGEYVIDKRNLTADHLGEEAGGECQVGGWSAFPAGLVPRFRDALTAGGYGVAVVDRRPSDQGMTVNQGLVERSRGSASKLLQAALAAPLAQFPAANWPLTCSYVGHLCCLYPEARTLIVVDSDFAAELLSLELARDPDSEAVGFVGQRSAWETRARCVVTNPTWAQRFKPGRWPLVLVVLHCRVLAPAACWAVMGLCARRVYTLVERVYQTKRTRLRLEAMSGPMIDL